MSQFNTPNYEIPRTTGLCASTGRELEPGEVYYATLVEVPVQPESEKSTDPNASETDATEPKPAETAQSGAGNALGLQRLDVSKEAWEEGYRPEHLFSFWKSTVPEPSEKKKLFVDNAVLMNLLERLGEAEEPERLAFRYVLALILMRKRLLRFDGAETRTAEVDGQPVEQEWWRLTPKLDISKGPMSKWNEERTIELLDPRLDETQIEQVTQQLGEILEAEL